MGLYFKLIRDVQAVYTNTAELGTIWKLNLSRVIVSPDSSNKSLQERNG